MVAEAENSAAVTAADVLADTITTDEMKQKQQQQQQQQHTLIS